MTIQTFYKSFRKNKQEALNKYKKLSLLNPQLLTIEMIAEGIITCREYLHLKHNKNKDNVPISESLKDKVMFFMEFFEAIQKSVGKDFIKETDFEEVEWKELQELCVEDS